MSFKPHNNTPIYDTPFLRHKKLHTLCYQTQLGQLERLKEFMKTIVWSCILSYTFYLQYSLYRWIKTNGQNIVYLDCMVQGPQETGFTQLGFFSLKPLAYFEGCCKKLPCGICFLYFKSAIVRISHCSV